MGLINRLSAEELAQRQESSRTNIKEHLELLASVEAQLKYQREVPGINVIDELICGWFDDCYWPDDEIFVSSFSAEELAAMVKFSAIFEDVLVHIEDNQISETAVLVRTTFWLRLVLSANSALKVLVASTCSTDK